MALLDIFKQHARLRQLEDRLETVEREVKRATLDWDEIYEKCRRAMGRVEKRAARAEDADPDKKPPTEAERVAGTIARRYRAVLSG